MRFPLCFVLCAALLGCERTPIEPSVERAFESGHIDLSESCAFDRSLDGSASIRVASAEAELAVERIVDYTGVPKNFVVIEADIANAAAVILGRDRVILYDPTLLDVSDWTSLGLLAHEVGHHLSGHTLGAGGRMDAELEADRFSGFVLGKMGATASEAQEVMSLIPPGSGGGTHPPKTQRVDALRAGWRRASEQEGRKVDPVTPDPVRGEVTLMEAEHTDGCRMDTYRGTVMQSAMRRAEGYSPALEVTLDLDGPGRETVYVEEQELSELSMAQLRLFHDIVAEGRRVELETATCGTGQFVNLYRASAR